MSDSKHAQPPASAHPDPAHDDGPHDGPHEGPIRTPKQLIWAVLASFVVPIIAIIMLVNYVQFGDRHGAGSESMGAEAVAKRLQRVGAIEIRDASGPAVVRPGDQVYAGQCAACHAAGAAGAPKFGDVGAWGARIKTGYDAMLASVLKGKGAMGAQGGGEYSDTEIGAAIVHMVNNAGGKLDLPKALAAAASGASGASSAAK